MTDSVSAEDVLAGAVDVYVHATPDFYPRQFDDIGLARCMQAAGMRAAVHRHHWSSTAERAELARTATGFDYFGGIVLNGTVGGINPDAVEMALRGGAVWVSLPDMGAKAWRDAWTNQIGLDPDGEPLRVTDELVLKFPRESLVVARDGVLVPGMHEILDLVAERDVVLSLGYVSGEEQLLAAQAAADRGIGKIVVTSPQFLRRDELAPLLAVDGVHLEFTCYLFGMNLMDPPGPTPTGAKVQADLIRWAGVERCVVGTSGGMAPWVDPPTDLLWGCQSLAKQGFTTDELRTLVQHTPKALLGIG